jgi:hypothetical protein
VSKFSAKFQCPQNEHNFPPNFVGFGHVRHNGIGRLNSHQIVEFNCQKAGWWKWPEGKAGCLDFDSPFVFCRRRFHGNMFFGHFPAYKVSWKRKYLIGSISQWKLWTICAEGTVEFQLSISAILRLLWLLFGLFVGGIDFESVRHTRRWPWPFPWTFNEWVCIHFNAVFISSFFKVIPINIITVTSIGTIMPGNVRKSH